MFQDPNETECFYTSAWGILGENPVIAFAGEHGSIRILSVINTQVHWAISNWHPYGWSLLDCSPFNWARFFHQRAALSPHPTEDFGVSFERSHNSNLGCVVRSHRFYTRRSTRTSGRGKWYEYIIEVKYTKVSRLFGPATLFVTSNDLYFALGSELWLSSWWRTCGELWHGSLHFGLEY